VTAPASTSGGRRLPRWIRWLHVYGSMLGLTATLLFAVTGLTLNHADWFEGGEPAVRTLEGTLPLAPLAGDVDELVVAETLRARYGLRGTVTAFETDDAQCTVIWKGPAYSADATIERADGRYRLEEARRPLIALLDDLHKGRDCGPVWAFVIDASAVVLAFLSLTGLWLLFYLKKRRRSGLVTALVGTVVLLVAFALGVA
jgi:hypothetical protein